MKVTGVLISIRQILHIHSDCFGYPNFRKYVQTEQQMEQEQGGL